MKRVLYRMAVLRFLSAPSMVRAQASLKRSAAVISSAKLTRQMLWAFALILTPVLCASFLKPVPKGHEPAEAGVAFMRDRKSVV